MKNILLTISVIVLSFSALFSQEQGKSIDSARLFLQKTTFNQNWKVYAPESGYLQKAFTDKDDPRFMIVNSDRTFKFGVGGFVNVVGFCDFNGMVEHKDFVTSQIPVLGKTNQAQFVIGAEFSRFNFKAVGSTKHGDVVAFIETDFRGQNNTLRLRHAYISYFGFTVGQAWSTFMDLEASPPTIDAEGPNNSIALFQPMIRYSGAFSPKWSFSVALEMNDVLVSDYPDWGVKATRQHYPDLPFYVKYKDKFGHLQLGGVLRNMNYHDTIASKNRYAIGYGIALSGKFNLTKKTFLYFQTIYGEGVAKYIQDLSYSDLDMVPDLDHRGKLRTLPMYGGYISIQRDWTEKLYSAMAYGYTKLNPPDQYNDLEMMFDHTHYFVVNLFWDVIPYGTIGIEYLFGQRVNQSGARGDANRINFLMRYSF